MNRRDRALLKKIGKYYLQYKGILDIEKLLLTFEGTKEISIDDYTLAYIYYYIMYIITRSVVKAAERAKESRLTYKEFVIDYSEELYGTLNVDTTIPVYHMGLVSFHTFKEGLNAPEYAILGYLLRKIYLIIREKRDKIPISSPQLAFFDFLKNFEKVFLRLEKLKEEFPNGFYRDPTYTDPDWLLRTYKAYFLARRLEEIRVGTKSPEKKVNEKELIKFVMWKLYELYTFYLVAKYLESKGYRIEKKGDEYIAVRGEKRLRLIFNAPLQQSSLKRVDEENDIERYKGRPDISILQNRPIIFECKYSSRISYITTGRFKIMAYTYEYDPLVSVLVYPGLEDQGINFDSEDSATRKLDETVKKRHGILDFWYNNHLLYMAIIDPLDDDSLSENGNLSKIDKLLRDYV
ncbi:Uncharacterized protein J5U23_01568 [Saccharolobus shibatae B12]|uniref:Uncharacterized protein n=1 Tax=Saccharolobus shibatae (strain ATCC 51178 / DSM 5389 / JCM 8931 / NBRC 15437 / B12) TaxID=523848 RepID=A0A8F5BNQ1_SACSH|nr:hypothetical protein [Saccharolobus shibatae]QXJ28699.1 Uncharacterized protein J5U23_01568 [Saccharolobus shibatae B12]